MKRFKLLLTFFLFACIQTAMAAETEPNDTKAQANTLALNGSNTGAIGTATDVDWWKVTTTGDGKLDVTIAVSNGVYLWCQIYDNDGTTLLTQGYTAGSTVVSQDGLAAGTYYLKLYPYYATEMPVYTISNTLTQPAQANDSEPNGTKATAITLPLNSSKTGHIGYYYTNKRDSADWYKVTTNEDGRLRLTVSSANGQYVWAYLYDNDGTTQLDASYTSGTAVVVNKDGLAAGTYYVRINTYYTTEFAPYTLSDDLFTPVEDNDNEPNNSKAQALTLPLNDSVKGHVDYYYNNNRDSSDWYKLTTNSDGRIRLTIKSGNGQYVWAYLYDNDGVTQLAANYTNTTAVVVDKDGLAAGTYYIRVNTYYNTDFAPYTLLDSLFTTVPDDSEPNNSKTQALTLPLNGSVTGHTNYYYNNKRDSSDWYKLVTNSDGRIRFTIKSANGQYVWAYLYDNDGVTQLAADYTNGTAVVVDKDGLAAGTYYIRVNTYYNTEFAPYTLSNTLSPYSFANDTEPNNYAIDAQVITPNTDRDGHVGFYYNNKRDTADWFKLNYTGKDGNLSFTINQEEKKSGGYDYLWFMVYKDTTASPVHSSYQDVASRTVDLTGIAKGDYWIKVFSYYSSDFSSYSFLNTFVPEEPDLCDGIDNDGDGQIDEDAEKFTWYADADGDGYGNLNVTKLSCSQPAGYVTNSTDCNDADNTIYPGAPELCDGKDNDCDGSIDEDGGVTWYRDADADGFGNAAISQKACTQPAGYVTNSTDCNDGDNTIYPGAPELCDGKDNDCDGSIDEDGGVTWYRDADGDGFGNAAISLKACTQPAGYVTNSTDCNDADNTIYPGAPELCDGKDNDCDGSIDEDGGVTWYRDADADGFGDAAVSQKACIQPAGYVANSTDCNDGDNTIYPGAPELCDGKDNDCDGSIDEDGGVAWYRDADGDGFGNAAISQKACTQPAGYVTNSTDCNDGDNTIYPSAPELCDGKDNDCDGSIDEDGGVTWYRDADADGFGNAAISQKACSQPAGYVTNSTDCNDGDNTIYPGAPELCDGKDNDCDGSIDEDGGVTWYRDADADGFGDAAVSKIACTQPEGYVADNTDCDDSDASVNPDAVEIADGKDNNCNGEVDEDTGGNTGVKVSVYDMLQKEPDVLNANMPFLVRLNKPSDVEVRVDFTTQDNTATSNSDYVAKSGTVVFAPGERVKRIVITVKADMIPENTEKFNVVLSNPVNADIKRGVATGLILDNDKNVTAANNNSISIQPSIEKGLKISPNPASVKANISLTGYNGAITIRVSNMQGKMLQEKKVQLAASKSAYETLDVSRYANGTYIVTVIDEKGNTQTAKLVVAD